MKKLCKRLGSFLCACILLAAGIGEAFAGSSESSTYAGVGWNGNSSISIDYARGTTSVERSTVYNDTSYVKVFVDALWLGQEQSYQNECQNKPNENYTWAAIELSSTLFGNHMISIASQHRIKLSGYAWTDWIYTGALY